MANGREKFQPYIIDSNIIPEFSLKAIILGAIFGIIFGASSVYLALRAGLTVSASVPIAVLTIAVFKKIGNSTILENNLVQTIGSAGESIAGGVVFTIPAFLFLSNGESFFNYFNIMTLALVGGILGILLMIPLRRSLIVKEHGTLPYPEGTACANVLIAGEKGGSAASKVFAGLGVAFIYKSLMGIFGLWKEVPKFQTGRTAVYPNAIISGDITPEYLGVGYLIGPKIAGYIVAGGILSWFILIPLISLIGDPLQIVLKPGLGGKLISEMTPIEIYLGYVRYIGVGAVAAAGLATLLKTLPTIISVTKENLKNLRELKLGTNLSRTDRDIPITYIIIGSIVLIIIVAILPQLPGVFPNTILMGLLVVIFGFFFVTVSSRIVGIIGSSSSPISAMTIATLIATCLIFVAIGWSGNVYQAIALSVGGIVCIAAANAGTTSQNLKTGYIVGATPIYQQLGLIIGVVVSVFTIGLILNTLDSSLQFQGIRHAIGTENMPAPQATLMATIIKGLLAQDLPWGFVFAGIFISTIIEICGVNSLPFAAGTYLPLSTTAPIFVGGMIRALVNKISKTKEESELSPGMLYSTGLVAGGSLTGIVIAILSSIVIGDKALIQILNIVHGWENLGPLADLIGLIAFTVLCYILIRNALSR